MQVRFQNFKEQHSLPSRPKCELRTHTKKKRASKQAGKQASSVGAPTANCESAPIRKRPRAVAAKISILKFKELKTRKVGLLS